MEERHKAKPARPATKPVTRDKADAKVTDLSVQRTGKRAAKAADKKPVGPISTEQRRQLIAQTAYFRALSRGFEGGDPVADWLDAEREVDQLLARRGG